MSKYVQLASFYSLKKGMGFLRCYVVIKFVQQINLFKLKNDSFFDSHINKGKLANQEIFLVYRGGNND